MTKLRLDTDKRGQLESVKAPLTLSAEPNSNTGFAWVGVLKRDEGVSIPFQVGGLEKLAEEHDLLAADVGLNPGSQDSLPLNYCWYLP